jgi:hypothetical protein
MSSLDAPSLLCFALSVCLASWILTTSVATATSVALDLAD